MPWYRFSLENDVHLQDLDGEELPENAVRAVARRTALEMAKNKKFLQRTRVVVRDANDNVVHEEPLPRTIREPDNDEA
jgi:hypothetical protein